MVDAEADEEAILLNFNGGFVALCIYYYKVDLTCLFYKSDYHYAEIEVPSWLRCDLHMASWDSGQREKSEGNHHRL